MAAQLDPVEVRVRLQQALVRLVVERLVVREVIGPARRSELDLVVGLARLKEQARAHGLAVGLLDAEFLAELALRLASHAVCRTCERREYRVAGAVGEYLGANRVALVGRQLEARHGLEPAVGHLRLAARAVEQKVDIWLEAHLLIENRVPNVHTKDC